MPETDDNSKKQGRGRPRGAPGAIKKSHRRRGGTPSGSSRFCAGVTNWGRGTASASAAGQGRWSDRERDLAGDTAGFEQFVGLGGLGQAQDRLEVHAQFPRLG